MKYSSVPGLSGFRELHTWLIIYTALCRIQSIFYSIYGFWKNNRFSVFGRSLSKHNGLLDVYLLTVKRSFNCSWKRYIFANMGIVYSRGSAFFETLISRTAVASPEGSHTRSCSGVNFNSISFTLLVESEFRYALDFICNSRDYRIRRRL